METSVEQLATAEPWKQKVLVPTLVFIGLMVTVVSSLGAQLIPTIAQSDHVSVSTAQWVLTAALLTGALATPVMGRLADGPRQRDVILFALVTMFAGCVLAAVAENFLTIVIGRGLQGVGLGLMPVTMATARSHLSPAKAGRAIATLSVTTAIGAGLGYPLTGFIVDLFDLHAAYWFGAILVAVATAISIVVLPPRSTGPARRFDPLGAGLLSLAVVGISTVLSEGAAWGWTSPLALSIMAVSLILLAVWIPYELKLADPLVQLRHVRNRLVLTADVSGFLICVAMYLFVPVLVEFVQIPASNGFGFGTSVVVAGLVLVPLSIGTFIATRFVLLYQRRFGARTMIPFGSVIFGSAGLLFALAHSDLWEAFVASGLAGVGVGFTFSAMPGFIVRAVPVGDTGSATGLYQVLRNVGLSMGSALGAAVLGAYSHRGHVYPSVGGFRTALLVSAGLCLATACISYVLTGQALRRQAPVTDAAKEVEEQMEDEAKLAGLMFSEEAVAPGGETSAK